MIDPVLLTADLVRCPSVTPEDAGALAVIEAALAGAGFATTRIDRGGISNLYARWGTAEPVFGFNGHTDVVPAGEDLAWRYPPFAATEAEGRLWGRGAADMKSGVAAFAAAAAAVVAEPPPKGSIALLITGDEEGTATDGTRAILDWMTETGEQLDACIVGEPTSREVFGDMVKIGRRGSMTGYITATGLQGHTAYPHRAQNPLPALARLVDRLARHQLDTGTDHFDASTLAVTTIDTGNPANNVIPARATATVNIRFNDTHTGARLAAWLAEETAKAEAESGIGFALRTTISGESFLTPPGPLSALVTEAIQAETGVTPELSTTGGTSDARFVKSHCPVVEFGLVGHAMHGVDEHVETAQIRRLTDVYRRILTSFFAGRA